MNVIEDGGAKGRGYGRRLLKNKRSKKESLSRQAGFELPLFPFWTKIGKRGVHGGLRLKSE